MQTEPVGKLLAPQYNGGRDPAAQDEGHTVLAPWNTMKANTSAQNRAASISASAIHRPWHTYHVTIRKPCINSLKPMGKPVKHDLEK